MRIEMIQFHRKSHQLLMTNKCKLHFLGYVKYAENQIHQFLPDLLKKLQDKRKVDDYQEALELAQKQVCLKLKMNLKPLKMIFKKRTP